MSFPVFVLLNLEVFESNASQHETDSPGAVCVECFELFLSVSFCFFLLRRFVRPKFGSSTFKLPRVKSPQGSRQIGIVST